MDAALLWGILLPPPATGAEILTWLGGAGARDAANAGVALIVQGVVGHIVRPDVVPDFLVGPVGQWADFCQAAVVVINLDLVDVGPTGPLLSPQPSDPGVQFFQHAPKGLDLAQVAAQQSGLD